MAQRDPTVDDIPPELTYCSDDSPGLRRRRSGRGFTYVGSDGKKVADDATLARIKRLAIPPAWTDVWIAPHDDCHVQATGRDARGRKQYRYHPAWTAWRDEVKYDRLVEFGEALPKLRRRVVADLDQPGLPRDKVLATVVHLLETTLVRVGNEEYAKANESFGLTTLRSRHVHVDGPELRLAFKAKSGKQQSVRVHDRRMARIVKQLQDLPGQQLFQYEEEGTLHHVTSGDVNTYLREITGCDFTAKDFRTWMGTLMAACALAEKPPPASASEAKRELKGVLDAVAAELRNTPAVCRGSYVHPAIVEMYVDGTLPDRWERAPARGNRLLVPEERKLLALLKPARRRKRVPETVAA
jgi:DNA topoisomerase-1